MEFLIVISIIIILIGCLFIYWNNQLKEFYKEVHEQWIEEEKQREKIILNNIKDEKFRIAFLNSQLPDNFWVAVNEDDFHRYFSDNMFQNEIKYVRAGKLITIIKK